MIDKSKLRVVNTVYRTKDYSLFNFHNFNRVIDDAKVKRLAKSMRKHGWVAPSKASIKPNGDFIDGQHRVLAAMSVGCYVDFTIDNVEYNRIPVINTNNNNWKPRDFVHAFSEAGTQSYRLLERFMENFPELNQTDAIMLCRNSLNAGNREDFQEGKLEISDMKLAYEWGRKIVSMKYHFPKYYNQSTFVRALIDIFTKKSDIFNFDEFIHKLKLRPSALQPTRTSKQYIQMIQDIYNYRRKDDEKVNLMF